MAMPKYAQDVPRRQLVRLLCRGGCGATRYAEVSKIPWSKSDAVNDHELFAVCLRCGYKARDNYNWHSA